MSSINLLPEDFRSRSKNGKEKVAVIMLSFFIVFVSAFSYAGIYIDKISASKKSDFLDSETKEIDGKIKKGIDNSGLFSVKDKTENVKDLLSKHYYFSKVFELIQETMADDVYLTKSELALDKNGNPVLKIGGTAKNYSVAADQIALYKNSYWVDSVNIGGLSGYADSGVNFEGFLNLKRDLILHHEYYWDFGLKLLSSKIDRYLKLNEYSADLKEEIGGGKNVVEVKFSGIAYKEEKIALLENDLKQMDVFVKDVSIFYEKKENGDSEKGAFEFRGEMKLNY